MALRLILEASSLIELPPLGLADYYDLRASRIPFNGFAGLLGFPPPIASVLIFEANSLID
jgi:hypothetical protein